MQCTGVTVLALLLAALSADIRCQDRTGALIYPDELNGVLASKEKRDADVQDDAECCEHGLPVDLAIRLSDLNSTDELLQYIDPESLDSRLSWNEHLGERNLGQSPTPAGCGTLKTVVSLRPENLTDPRQFHFPSCTRVERCSGCCTSKALSCQPVETRTVLFKINILENVGKEKLRFLNFDTVAIEEHVSCKCACRKKASDCNQFQQYVQGHCSCLCTNTADRTKCLEMGDYKQWNEDTCSCECTEKNMTCTSGTHFDRSYCRCIQNDYYKHEYGPGDQIPPRTPSSTSNRFWDKDRRSQILKPVRASALPPAGQAPS